MEEFKDMEEFDVIIEEHFSQRFKVRAKNVESAEETAKKMYNNEEITVSRSNKDIQCKLISVADEDGDYPEFTEF